MKILTLLLLAFLSCPQSSTTQQPTSAAESAISAEGLGIYRDFLNFYIGKGSAKLNLVETTTIFTADDFDDDCLKGFPPDAFGTARQQSHRFDASTTKGWPVVLIDPEKAKIKDPEGGIRKGESVEQAVKEGFQAAHFSFSEIVFNPDHTRAMFKYGFHCGSLCGNGGTVLLEKKDGKWIRSKQNCGRWMS